MFRWLELYIANYCENYCVYCGFNSHNRIHRARLNMEQLITIDTEAERFYIKGTNRVRKNLHSSRINEEDKRRMISVYEFESSILELQRKQEYQEAMYRIHKQFIQWKREKYFSECDIFFRQLDVANYDIRILVALLMASVQIKQRLSYRALFYNKVIERASCFYSEIEITQIFSSLR